MTVGPDHRCTFQTLKTIKARNFTSRWPLPYWKAARDAHVRATIGWQAVRRRPETLS